MDTLLADALEGDHFVPRVGGNAVTNFENHVKWADIYGSVESELKAVWAACDTQSYMTDKAGRCVTIVRSQIHRAQIAPWCMFRRASRLLQVTPTTSHKAEIVAFCNRITGRKTLPSMGLS